MPLVIMAAGAVSDRGGRRPLILIGAAVLIAWAFPFFWLAETTNIGLLLVAMFVSSFGQALTYGPLAAFMAEAKFQADSWACHRRLSAPR